MEFSSSTVDNNSLCALCGEITFAEIPSLTPRLSAQLNAEPSMDLVLDLSGVSHIDSGAIRLIVNIKKRVEKTGKSFYLLKPSESVMQILEKLEMTPSFAILESMDDLREDMTKNKYDQYLPYSHSEEGLHRLNCSCAVCGSSNTAGYLINPSQYEWRWDEGDPFPTGYRNKTNKPFNVFGLLPVVCLDCCMSSIEMSHFHAMQEGTIAIHSLLADEEKSILSKNIKQRKRVVEQTGENPFDLFVYPRSKTACYLAYELARMCSRSMAIGKRVGSHFTIGYTTFLTIQFAVPSLKDDLINDCRTWFTHVLNERGSYNSLHLAISFFVLLNVALHLKKPK
ncbi:MAG: STAS domain-containing protein, partial [Chitinivibrionales bacterium]|nr:STAS domain-containing protein [Chitinivibrionales bacterium]